MGSWLWWLKNIFIALFSLFFLVFGINALMAAYSVKNPYEFIMYFPGIIIIHGARQYGKSTWLEGQLHQTILDHGPAPHAQDAADAHQHRIEHDADQHHDHLLHLRDVVGRSGDE